MIDWDWVPVASSLIQAVAYKPETRILAVRFSDSRVTMIGGVPSEQYDALIAAKSKGKYFLYHFKDNPDYTFTKEQPVLPKQPKTLTAATPLYLALQKTKQVLRASPRASFLYMLWCATGKEQSPQQPRYIACLQLLSEVSPDRRVDKDYLDAAIDLAKERRI